MNKYDLAQIYIFTVLILNEMTLLSITLKRGSLRNTTLSIFYETKGVIIKFTAIHLFIYYSFISAHKQWIQDRTNSWLLVRLGLFCIPSLMPRFWSRYKSLFFFNNLVIFWFFTFFIQLPFLLLLCHASDLSLCIAFANYFFLSSNFLFMKLIYNICYSNCFVQNSILQEEKY